jgi:beta-glucanase (GH16 family)
MEAKGDTQEVGMGKVRLSAAGVSAVFLAATSAMAALPAAPSFASSYQRVWGQDFTTMTSDSQLGISGNTGNINQTSANFGGGTWVAHKPDGQDWCDFISPAGHNDPFGINGPGSGNNYLTIRAQHDPAHTWNNWNGDYTMGLLSSMDSAGRGFAQKYGYFEASFKTPGGANTWPAFWLLDAPSLTNRSLAYCAEIDITESYGNWGAGRNYNPAGDANYNQTSWHNWSTNGGGTTGDGSYTYQPGMTSGFHTYGVDIEPTGITWYFDRQQVWSAPIYDAAERPMFVLLNLGMGGGNHNNADGSAYNWNLTPSPSDMQVQYVAVWASPYSPNYVVPEPASLGVIIIGLAGLLGRRRQGQKA